MYPCGQKRPSRALDDALDRLRSRPDRPRAHGRARHRHAQLRPDERAEHADHRHGGQGLGPVGRDRAPALPRGARDLAYRRRDGPGDRHRHPQPRPRAAQPARGHGRARRGPRPGRPDRRSTGCATRRPTTRRPTPASTARASCRPARGRSATPPRRPRPPLADITASTANTHPVAADEVVYVETNHPNDRVLPVTWTLNGAVGPQHDQQPQPGPRRAERCRPARTR